MNVQTLASRLGVPPRTVSRAQELFKLAAAKLGSGGPGINCRAAVCLELACAACVTAIVLATMPRAPTALTPPPRAGRSTLWTESSSSVYLAPIRRWVCTRVPRSASSYRLAPDYAFELQAYLSQLGALGGALDVRPVVTVAELALKFGCTLIVPSAERCLATCVPASACSAACVPKAWRKLEDTGSAF
jgi:hypothetical protein